MFRALFTAAVLLATAAHAQVDQARLEAWRKKGPAAVPEMLSSVGCVMDAEGAATSAVMDEWIRMGAPAVAALLAQEGFTGCEEGADRYSLVAQLACATPAAKARSVLAPLFVRPVNGQRQSILNLTADYCPKNEALAKLSVPVFVEEINATKSGQPSSLYSVQKLGPLAADAAPALANLLRQPALDAQTRRRVLEALVALGPAAKSAVPVLRSVMVPPSVEQRALAAEAIGGTGGSYPEMKHELLELLVDTLKPMSEDPGDRCRIPRDAAARVAGAYAKLGFPPYDALMVLNRASVQNPACESIQREVFVALGAMGPKAKELYYVVRGVLRDPNAPVSLRAIAGDALTKLESALDEDRVIIAALEKKTALHGTFPGMKRAFPPMNLPQEQWGSRDLGTELQVCLEEAGRPLPGSWDKVMALHGLKSDTDLDRGLAARCLESRLCGPDEATLSATLRHCCAQVYKSSRPGWCPPAAK